MVDTNSTNEEVPILESNNSTSPTIGDTAEKIRLLFISASIEDSVDRKTIQDAVDFLERPTADPEDTIPHLQGIGMVLAYSFPDIEGQPPELSDINRRLEILISQQRINLIEAELAKIHPDTEKIKALLKAALNSTGILVTYYQENSLQTVVRNLEQKFLAKHSEDVSVEKK